MFPLGFMLFIILAQLLQYRNHENSENIGIDIK